MASALVQATLTVRDYLDWELQQTEKHDFFQGEVFAMTGGTLRHNRASFRSMMAFENHLQGKPCKVFGGDVKVAVNVTEHCFTPTWW